MSACAPLYEALMRHRQTEQVSLHMPGHKGRAGCLAPLGKLPIFDVTELPSTGSLFDAEGPTLLAEQAAAKAFGTAGTFFSAGGCTLCIQAMLRLAAPLGGTVVMGRTVHRSAVHAMALLGITPIWVWPRQDAGPGLAGRIQADDVAKALQKHPDAKAVYLTTPDYYGVMSDLNAICAAAQQYNVPVIVDNAHGAHLFFLDRKLHPLSQGAAMCADSAHKTLPVLTGGAYFQIGSGRYLPQVRAAMALFGSTSPSFPILLSLDLCRAWLEEERKAAYAKTAAQANELNAYAQTLGFLPPEGLCDPLHLVWNTAHAGISGKQAALHLRSAGIEVEYADEAFLILLLSPFNTEKDFAQLRAALTTMPVGEPFSPSSLLPAPPPIAASPREALLSPKVRLPLCMAQGRIAAQTACPCPPAIPAIMPGERITPECADLLAQSGILEIEVVK